MERGRTRQFERAYPLGSSERLVYSILLYTGLRIGDAARLGRQHIQKDGTIQLRNEKTGAVVYLPILAPLRQALAAGPKGRPEQLAFITLRRGTNVGKEHLGAWFSEAAERPASSIARRTAFARPPLDGSPRPARRSIS